MGGIPSGKLSDEELPAVGDWVAVRPVEGEQKAVIEAVLPRRTSFTRKEAWQRTVEQVVAANVDTVFIVTAFGFDLSPRRLERYLTAAWDSGSNPGRSSSTSATSRRTPRPSSPKWSRSSSGCRSTP